MVHRVLPQVLQGLQHPATSRRKCYKGYNNPLHPAASATRVTTTHRIPPQVLQGLQQPATSYNKCYKCYNHKCHKGYNILLQVLQGLKHPATSVTQILTSTCKLVSL